LKRKYEVLKAEKMNMETQFEALDSIFFECFEENMRMKKLISELKSKEVKLDTKVADLQRSGKNKDAQIRRDKTKIATLQEENKVMSEKLSKVEKGWRAFKGLEDVFETKN
jgi:chromosome segregation ATPase